MERFGFVGLPNAGKSSLYNALAGGGALAAPYAFATTDPNVGVAKVFDERLDKLAEMSQSKNVISAAVQFTDIGGLVEGHADRQELGGGRLHAGRAGDGHRARTQVQDRHAGVLDHLTRALDVL